MFPYAICIIGVVLTKLLPPTFFFSHRGVEIAFLINVFLLETYGKVKRFHFYKFNVMQC